MTSVVRDVQNWSGGTRIVVCLRAFNQRWVRRVAGDRCTGLLVSDVLKQGTPDDPHCEQLLFEVERSFKTCRRLIWLNPLWRFDAFQSRTAGICAMLSCFDPSVPEHILESLQLLPQMRARRKPTAGRALRTAA